MTTAHQIKDYIEKNNIKNELKNSFLNLLTINNCEDLNVKHKDFQIDENNIEYEQTFLGFHLFKTPILKQNNEIGYYALEYDNNFEIIDDFFVIYDEIENLVNKIAQNKISFRAGKNLIIKNKDFNFIEVFDILRDYIFNSIPNKSDYNSKTYQEAIKTIPLKQTSTPVIILSKFPTKIAINKLRELPKSEYIKVITSLLWIFKITDTERRETECINGCGHLWHNLD